MRIYIILGPSASGKDTVYQKLLQQCPQLRPIVYYTTRPRRANESRQVVTESDCVAWLNIVRGAQHGCAAEAEAGTASRLTSVTKI